jgi:hypothetical protein
MIKRYIIKQLAANGEPVSNGTVIADVYDIDSLIIFKIKDDRIPGSKELEDFSNYLKDLKDRGILKKDYFIIYGAVDMCSFEQIDVEDQSMFDSIFVARGVNIGSTNQNFVMVDSKTGATYPLEIRDSDIIIRRKITEDEKKIRNFGTEW